MKGRVALDLTVFGTALATFGLIALSSQVLGRFFNRFRFPQITGFLITGILAGPYVLGLIRESAVEQVLFLDRVALGFIAFAAGGELLLKELRSRLKSIRWITLGLVLFTFTACSLTVFGIADSIPFMADLRDPQRWAVAILAGAILVARSPSSAIAVVNELRARGPFTRSALGVTVVMDVIVILLFAVCTSLADAIQTSGDFSLIVLAIVALEVMVSIILGVVLGKVILPLLFRLPLATGFHAFLVLALGFGVFEGSAAFRHFTGVWFEREILLEPLLICMSASFVLTNFTSFRASLQRVLDAAGPLVYVVFFTLAGASLRIDVLADTWVVALVLFAVRVGAIFCGSLCGGTMAGDPARHNRVAWMAFITQAGIGLGLAKEAAVEFPEWGGEFATLIIGVIVLNQIVGPPLFKWVLHIVGEAHVGRGRKDLAGTPLAIIFGLDAQSTALARQLDQHGWRVRIASRQATEPRTIPQTSAEIVPITGITLEELQRIEAGSATAIVCLIEDEASFQVCELAYEHFGTRNLIAQLHDREKAERFQSINVRVVDPETAFVGLLDHFVRSPGAVSLLLGMDEGQDVEDFEIRNDALHGLALRDLKLPLDTLVLSVTRKGAALVSHGYTVLHLGDIVTVVGSEKSLVEVSRKFS